MTDDIIKPDEIVTKAPAGVFSHAPSILQAPVPTKEGGQRSVNVSDLFLTRFTPPWARPASLPAYTWRAWVMNQPVALVCRETLISTLESLDWKITPRNMKYKDELDPVARYYTKLIESGGNYPELGFDYSSLLEWIIGDMLDVPFGGFAEIGRKQDTPGGRVLWIKPVDAGTLYPTLNGGWPVVQYYQGYEAIAFPVHAQARVLWSPHPYLYREGWGIAPPEKIYFALDMLNRGDKYYANLLLDVPAAGILDLGDMDAESARDWIESFRTFVNDTTTSFKIPVLYEHNNDVKFLPFGKPPSDLMFDRITLRYAALVCAAYGMTLGDIGLSDSTSAGGSLAGAIRQERKTKRTGFARVKKKWKAFWDSILPDTLEFTLIDYDEELNVAMGRARLASATAFNILQQGGSFSPQEVRSQTLQDGLISITVPDELPPEAKPAPQGKPQERPGALGAPVPASGGGEGEVRQSLVEFKLKNGVLLDKAVAAITKQVYDKVIPFSEDDLFLAKSMVQDSLYGTEDELELQSALESVARGKIITFDFKALDKALRKDGRKEDYISKVKSRIRDEINVFLAKSAAITMMEVMDSEVVIDNPDLLGYDYIAGETQKRMLANLPELVNLHVQSILDETKG